MSAISISPVNVISMQNKSSIQIILKSEVTALRDFLL